jgi:hypothetical protein
MSKLKIRLVKSVGAVTLALLAVSFAFAASHAYADDVEGGTLPSRALTADTDPVIAEGIAVLCHSYGNAAETCVTGGIEFQSTAEIDSPASEPAQYEPAVNAGPAPGIHSVDAIMVEITQSVTIALAGEAADDKEDYTGSLPEQPAPELGRDTETSVVVVE